MQVREYGNYFRINLNEDITTTENTIELYKPKSLVPTVITTAQGLTVGNVDIIVGTTTYKTGEYLQYKVEKDVISEAGVWNAIATVKDAVNITFKITKRIQFSVAR